MKRLRFLFFLPALFSCTDSVDSSFFASLSVSAASPSTNPNLRNVTVTNQGGKVATKLTVSGFNSFSSPGTGGTCASSLNVGQSCVFVLDFSTVSLGSAPLVSYYNGNSTNTIPLQLVTLSNIHQNSVVQTGFLVGTSARANQVGVQLDGGAIQTATGTGSWTFKLPTGQSAGSSAWRLGSKHTITFGAINGTKLDASTTITVFKGNNRDLDGDGYPDLVVGGTSGVVYIYPGSSSGLTNSSRSILTSGGPGPEFGAALTTGDLDGDGYADLAIGDATTQPGCVTSTSFYVLYGTSSGIPSQTVAPLVTQSNMCFGASLASGDFNADGFDDLAVGAPKGAGSAQLYAYSGGALRMSAAPTPSPVSILSCTDPINFADAGQVTAADVNGDGYVDLFVGSAAGKVYFYPGSASSVASASFHIQPGAFVSALTLGDINGDGIPDLIVGDNTDAAGGAIYLYQGPNINTTSPTKYTVANTQGFGSAATIADINGDGLPEVLVSDGSTSSATYPKGVVFVYEPSPLSSLNLTIPVAKITSSLASAFAFGGALAVSDFNGDGFGDTVIGDPNFGSGTGAVFFFGGKSAIPSTAILTTTLPLTNPGDGLGASFPN